MPIPDYQSIMLPLLKFAGDKKEHSLAEAIEHTNLLFRLAEEEKKLCKGITSPDRLSNCV